MRIRTRSNFWVGFLVLLLVGTAFTLVGAYLLKNNLELVKNGIHTKATVIDIVKHRNTKSTTYYPLVEFTTSDGQLARVESSTGVTRNAYKEGDKIDIIYSALDPNNFIYDKFFHKYGFPAIFFFCGVVCLIIDINNVIRKIRFG